MGKTLITAVLLWCNLYIRVSHMISLEKNCFISCSRLKKMSPKRSTLSLEFVNIILHSKRIGRCALS